MKKQLLFVLTLLVAVSFSSCRNMRNLDSNLFTSTPNPLETKAGKVEATITGTFPVRYFQRNAVVTVTPVLRMSNGNSVKGTPSVFQGQRVRGNNRVIPFRAGGSFTMRASFDYVPEMAVSELFLEFEVVRRRRTSSLRPVKVADGVIATSELVKNELKSLGAAVIIPDRFERDILQMTEADIMFLIQQSNIRRTETTSQDIVALASRIVAARDALNESLEGLTISSYASPDGSLDLNTRLAEARLKETERFINGELRRIQSTVSVESRFTPEDWDGFRKLMEESTIQDRDLILRVLSMYQDPEQREREIKNLAAAFKQIADEVLPKLRRSRLKLVVKITGKSDEEIANLARTNASALNLEELLYAATLTTDLNAKVDIYQKVISAHPNCPRGHNNLGVVRFEQGNPQAASLFQKALQLDPNNADINYNAGLCAMMKAQYPQALAYFGKAAGTKGNLNNALGTYYIVVGDYVRAKSSFGDTKTNNAALLHILNREFSTARSTLAGIANPDAMTAYLSAVVAARTNDRDGVLSNLRSAVNQNRNLAARASRDMEFARYWTDSAFQAIVR